MRACDRCRLRRMSQPSTRQFSSPSAMPTPSRRNRWHSPKRYAPRVLKSILSFSPTIMIRRWITNINCCFRLTQAVSRLTAQSYSWQPTQSDSICACADPAELLLPRPKMRAGARRSELLPDWTRPQRLGPSHLPKIFGTTSDPDTSFGRPLDASWTRRNFFDIKPRFQTRRSRTEVTRPKGPMAHPVRGQTSSATPRAPCGGRFRSRTDNSG